MTEHRIKTLKSANKNASKLERQREITYHFGEMRTELPNELYVIKYVGESTEPSVKIDLRG